LDFTTGWDRKTSKEEMLLSMESWVFVFARIVVKLVGNVKIVKIGKNMGSF
jgi:hypothetical protein